MEIATQLCVSTENNVYNNKKKMSDKKNPFKNISVYIFSLHIKLQEFKRKHSSNFGWGKKLHPETWESSKATTFRFLQFEEYGHKMQ